MSFKSGTRGSMSQKVKILLVEDQDINQIIANSLLKKAGAEVDIAETGKISLSKIQQNHYDLVLMDLGLPDTDGYQVTQEIRKLGNALNLIPIIAVTAHVDEESKKKAIQVGMNGFIEKPLDDNKIKDIFKRFLNQ